MIIQEVNESNPEVALYLEFERADDGTLRVTLTWGNFEGADQMTGYFDARDVLRAVGREVVSARATPTATPD